MTIEEKATAYDKALEKARNFELPEYQRVMKELFPELRMTKYIDKGKELTCKDIEIILGIENNILHECSDNSQLVIEAYPKGENYYGEILRRFNNQRIKPQRMVSAEAKEALYDKPAWSEEDAFRTSTLTDVVKSGGSIRPELRNEFVDWLESLKERYTWKPTDEQMDELENEYLKSIPKY